MKKRFILGLFLTSVLLISATMFISGVAKGGNCDSTGECDAGLFCCVSGCGVGHPTCQPSISKLKCTTDADCKSTKICKDGQCIRSSTTSAGTSTKNIVPRGWIAVAAADPNIETCYVKNSAGRARFFGLVISN